MMSMELKTKLMQISHYCKQHEFCEECIYRKGDYCMPEDLTDYLATRLPYDWDANEIERILENGSC